jgi:DNA-directed RNA polymerase specialized sigma24 family protein
MTAVGVLFGLHHLPVFRMACAATRSNDLVEDVTQQVFINAYRTIKSYDTHKPFTAIGA